jgi:phosphate transport system substrate-binding protein
MKKLLGTVLAVGILATSLVGCGQSGKAKEFNLDTEISVISREDGSGTRGAFVELTGVEEKKSDGTKKDNTTKEAIIKDGTDKILTTVSGDMYSIGYISLGSLNDSVKALSVDGIEANAQNVKDGKYPIARPFNIATKAEPTGLAKDFIDYIMSKEGQEIIVKKGFIAVKDDAPAYAGTKPSGKITVGGSSSVSPVMEKLIEGYKKVNPSATVELQTNDSSAGMKGAMSGTFDIGMASRELKSTEKAELKDMAIAIDGIAVIVNKDNTLSNVSKTAIKDVFVGKVMTWEDVK